MREVMARNELEPERPGELHLHAARTTSTPSSRPSPRAQHGPQRGAAAVRARDRRAGRAAARDPRCSSTATPTPDHEPRARLPARGASRCAATWRARSRTPWPRVQRARSARIPVYPAAGGYALGGELAKLASNETPFPPLPAGARGGRGARCATLNRYPDPTNARAAQRARRDRYGVPRRADRDRQRLVRHPARRRRGAARAGRRDRLRVAVVLDLPAPRRGVRRARDQVPLERRRTSTTSTRCAREITAATRLVIVCNPNNPTVDGAAARRRSPRSSASVPRHVARDPRRGLHASSTCSQDPDESLDLLERHPNLVLLRTFSKVYGLCGLRVGYALCGSEEFRARGRPGAPAVLLQRARAGRRRPRRSTTRTRSTRRVERRPSPSGMRAGGRAAASCGLETADSQANFSWFDRSASARRGRDVVRRARRARRARARRQRARPRRARCA